MACHGPARYRPPVPALCHLWAVHMDGLRLGCIAVAVLALTAAVPAHADGATFLGICNYAARNDTTPGGSLGGESTWRGIVYLRVVPTDDGVPTGGAVTAS